MQVGFGRSLPDGKLPVFSTRTEEEARMLITMTCPMGYDGEYYARELLEEQTLENLAKYSDRIQKAHDLLVAKGNCRCDD